MLMVMAASWLWSCDNEEDDLSLRNLQTYLVVVQESKNAPKDVSMTAFANNALSFSWDVGINELNAGETLLVSHASADSLVTDTLTGPIDAGSIGTFNGVQILVRYPRTDSSYVVTVTAKGPVDQKSVTDTVRWK